MAHNDAPEPTPPEAAATSGALPTRAHTGRGHAAHRPWYKRLRIVGGGAGALTAVAIGIAFAATSGGEPAALAPSPSATATPVAGVTSSAPLPSESNGVAPSTVATVAGDELPVYANPGDPDPKQRLSKWTYYGQPMSALSLERVVLEDGEAWHYVKLPVQPNGAEGWIRESDVTISHTSTEVRIYLGQRILEFYEDGERTMRVSVVVGRERTPTPTGTYFVADLLDLQANPSGLYGAYALGLSAYSELLSEFNGGPPQIAIHGTNQPSLLGSAASNGCIRLLNEDVLALAGWVERGTPVHIFASEPPAGDPTESAEPAGA